MPFRIIILHDMLKTEKIEQIRERMKQTTYLTKAGHKVQLGASFGIATFHLSNYLNLRCSGCRADGVARYTHFFID